MTTKINTYQAAEICKDRIFYGASEQRIAQEVAMCRKLMLKDSAARPKVLAEIDGLMHAMHSYLTDRYPELEFNLNRNHLLNKFQCDLGFDCTPDSARPKNIGAHYE